jgi:hypothetical protein
VKGIDLMVDRLHPDAIVAGRLLQALCHYYKVTRFNAGLQFCPVG